MERTKRYTLIRSPKHPGAVFIKTRDSHDDFICKFYPLPSGKERQADVNKLFAFEEDGIVGKLVDLLDTTVVMLRMDAEKFESLAKAKGAVLPRPRHLSELFAMADKFLAEAKEIL